MTTIPWLLQLGGAIGGVLGAFFLAMAQQAGSAGSAQIREGRVEPYVVLRYPRLWPVGLVLLLVGFVLQFVGLLCQGAR